MTELRRTVESFWALAEARDWSAFAETLAEDVVYTLPQTRERISGRERFVEFNREYPGDWHLRVERIVAEPGQVVTWARFSVDLEEMDAVSFFTGDESGLISTIMATRRQAHIDTAGRSRTSRPRAAIT
jgi:hypothetical protein